MNPRNRLAAELAWLPQPAPLQGEQELPALVHANLSAARWESSNPDEPPAGVAAFLCETADIIRRASAAAVLRDINADRAVSGFPRISSEQQLQEELSARLAQIGSIVNAALNRLRTPDLIDAVTAALGMRVEGATPCTLPFIDDFVDRHYEVGTRAFLDAEAASVMTLIEAARQRARFGEAALSPYLAKLEDVVRNWRRTALPILISAKARGINHKPAVDLAGSLRELSVHLNNEHHMFESMRRLNALLIECFAEVPHLHARLHEDAAFLEKTASDYQAWARTIGFRAEIGLFRKDILSIGPSGVAWNHSHYPLKAISRIRFGGMRLSIFALMGLPSYVVAFGDPTTETVVPLTTESLYGAFIDRLWRAVGSRLSTELFTSLKAGNSVHFGRAVVHDDGIELPRRKLLGKREYRRYAWEDIKTWNYDGRCFIASTAGKRHRVGLSYRNVHNVGVLSSAISAARKRPGLRKLSELLDGH
jgi:hypothetical protein